MWRPDDAVIAIHQGSERELMTEDSNNTSRRTMLKGVASAGLAGAGIAAATGSASAFSSIEIDEEALLAANNLSLLTVRNVATPVSVGNVEINVLSPNGDQVLVDNAAVQDVVEISDNCVVIVIQNVLSEILSGTDISAIVVQAITTEDGAVTGIGEENLRVLTTGLS